MASSRSTVAADAIDAVRIIDAGVERLDALMVVMRDSFDPAFGEAWSAAQLVGTLVEATSFARLAVLADDRPAGFSLCRGLGPEVELLLIAVVPNQRSLGIGRALIDRACSDARNLAAAEIFLEVRENNMSARRLYGQTGFAEVGRRRDYYAGAAGARFAAVTMRRLLSA